MVKFHGHLLTNEMIGGNYEKTTEMTALLNRVRISGLNSIISYFSRSNWGKIY